jgi:hypothetical protein
VPRSAWYDRRHSARYRAIEFLSLLTRGRIKGPFYYGSVAYHREHDPEEWRKARPKRSEHVVTWALWTVEAYTPDNINALLQRLDDLRPVSESVGNRRPGDWLRATRAKPGSSFNLPFRPKGAKSLVPSGFSLPIPPFAKHSAATIISATPSLTFLASFHLLRDDERMRLDAVAHTDHPTKITALGRGVAISTPDLEMRRLVDEQRAAWVRSATDWQREHFGGLFCASGDTIPTCEFSTIVGARPFAKRPKGESSNLLECLGLIWSPLVFDSQSAKDEPQLCFCPWVRSTKTAHYSIVTMPADAFTALDAEAWGGDDEGRIFRLDERIRRTFAAWSALRVVGHFTDQIARARDQAAAVVGSRNAAQALSRVRRDSAQCFDAATVARELEEHAKLISMERLPLRLRDLQSKPSRTFSDVLERTLTERSKRLVADVAELNSNLHAQANLLSAHANLKLQPWIIVLAIASAVAGIISALEPARKAIWGP